MSKKFRDYKSVEVSCLLNAMAANSSEEVLTLKTQGLSDEERLRDRERGRNNRQRSSAVEREREKERAWEKRCRSTEVQREREQETQLLKQGKPSFIAWQKPIEIRLENEN